tara:strand:- start:153 stop:506 length:354 start_codon:yes stop_codon:yes gene_type:complete
MYIYKQTVMVDSPSSIILDETEKLTHSIEINNEHRHNINRLEELERKMDLENTWKSFCLRTDKRAVIFFSQLSISIAVMSFCCVQLVRLENCEAQSLYSGLLSLVIGIHLPQPKIKK